MPKHRVHRYVSRMLLGKPYGEVHAAINRPYVFLGKKHKRMFHTPEEAYVMGVLAGSDRRGGLAGVLHVMTDEMCSKDREMAKFLDWMARIDAENSKHFRLMEQYYQKTTGKRKKRKRSSRFL